MCVVEIQYMSHLARSPALLNQGRTSTVAVDDRCVPAFFEDRQRVEELLFWLVAAFRAMRHPSSQDPAGDPALPLPREGHRHWRGRCGMRGPW